MPEWLIPLINLVIVPFLVIVVGLLGWVVMQFRKSFEATQALALRVPDLVKRVDDLEAERDAALADAADKTKLLDTERLEHTQTKQALVADRADHLADVERLNAQHLRDVTKAVTDAVDAEAKKHQTTIDNLKGENTKAIQLAVDKAVLEAVAPLKAEIQRLTDENAELTKRQTRVEKRDTDDLVTPPNMANPGIPSDSGD